MGEYVPVHYRRVSSDKYDLAYDRYYTESQSLSAAELLNSLNRNCQTKAKVSCRKIFLFLKISIWQKRSFLVFVIYSFFFTPFLSRPRLNWKKRKISRCPNYRTILPRKEKIWKFGRLKKKRLSTRKKLGKYININKDTIDVSW